MFPQKSNKIILKFKFTHVFCFVIIELKNLKTALIFRSCFNNKILLFKLKDKQKVRIKFENFESGNKTKNKIINPVLEVFQM